MALVFNDLWNEHPYIKDTESAPCRTKAGDSGFANQCAIRLGLALQANGVSTSSFRGIHCWFSHGRQHILRAQQLAEWLKTQDKVFGKVSVRKKVKAADYIGKTGILFCNNFKDGGSFDHIDLWDGFQGADYRFAKGLDRWIELSQDVWFWDIK